MKLFDTHVHLTDGRYDEDREALIAALPENHVLRCVTVGADMDSSAASLALAERYPEILRATVGVHPHDADTLDDAAMEQLEAWLAQQGTSTDDLVYLVKKTAVDYLKENGGQKIGEILDAPGFDPMEALS
jgi:TatD DNase family protein